LEGRDRSAHRVRQTRCEVDKRPKVVAFFAREQFADSTRRYVAQRIGARGQTRILQLSKNRIGPGHRILYVRSGLSLQRKRFLEIKRDYRRARVLQQEVSQGGDCNSSRRFVLLALAEVGVSR